ncbi:hypothetical protein, partial [Nodularia sp. UHCC 0506]|uniref:hypothetical protein n=1 Tax=Nodularia sp. UHCC 0506 TaxID=3110243 RepID=UPI002B1F56E6
YLGHIIYMGQMQTITPQDKCMAIFKQPNKPFLPANNQEGLSQITFLGFEPDDRMTEVIYLRFEVMGLVKGTSDKIVSTIGSYYQPENGLGKMLKAMGFEPKPDENGFEQFDSGDLGDRIDEFLNQQISKKYTAKMNKDNNGDFKIDLETLKVIHTLKINNETITFPSEGQTHLNLPRPKELNI